jgi:predicted N-acetyltransferase YhbS
MPLIIRPERTQDYARIAQINVEAFDHRSTEASIVALQRQALGFDPELSLVAEFDQIVVGHALFSPLTIRLLDQDAPAVLVGPIAIDPAHQRKGLGDQLMREGHRVATEKGFHLSFLLGHTSYYPRFGYQTDAFGASSVQITPPAHSEPLETRHPLPADLPALMDLWRHEEGAIDFTILPDSSLVDWLSPNPQISATVYLRAGEIVGFTRIKSSDPAAPLVFLARTTDAARWIAAQIGAGLPALTLPLHPRSASAPAFAQQPVAVRWAAAMVLPLLPGVFDSYVYQCQSGMRPAGRPIFPVAFDME